MSTSSTEHDVNSGGEDETYRLLPPEPRAGTEPRPRQVGTASTDAGSRKPTRKRRRPAAADEPARDEPTVVAVQSDWKPDTGWREPPLISAVWFPFTGSGTKLLLAYVVLLWLATVIPFPLAGALAGLFVLVFLSVMLLETANFTLEGIPVGPQIPEWTGLETIGVGLLGLVIFLTGWLPLIAGTALMGRLETQSPWALIALTAVGFFYLPMGFVVLGDLQDERALNPLVVFRGLRKMLQTYLALCGIAAAIFLLPLYLLILLQVNVFVLSFAVALLLVYVSVALIRAVSLAARRKGVTFEDGARHESDAD